MLKLNRSLVPTDFQPCSQDAAKAAAELAQKFEIVVDVLNEVRDGAGNSSDLDLLRTYEVWLRTGSRRAEELLRQNGVVPITQAGSPRRH